MDYACKFGSYVSMKLGQKVEGGKKYLNIEWVKEMKGYTATDEEQTTANEFNKKWLLENNFDTTARKSFQVRRLHAMPRSRTC